MTNMFTYGSLMSPEVIFKLLSHHYQSCKAVLPNYVRRQVKDRVYPGVKKNEGGSVQGVLYFSLSAEDVQILNDFQRDEYICTPVTVSTEKGEIPAYVYEYKDITNLLDEEWNIENFVQRYKNTFAQKHNKGQL